MRFIGSKRLLLKNIDYVIQQNIKGHKNLKSFCDIFSGTTVVAQYFKKRYQIFSNDLLYFSYCLQKSYIELNKEPKFENLNINSDLFGYLNKIETTKKGFIYKNYSPGGKDKRRYLSEANAKKIDSLRMSCEEWLRKKIIHKDEYFYLISLLIEATPFVSNIAGTYGAYLKNWDKRSLKKIKFNSIKIIDNKKINKCFNEDSNNLIKKIKGDILYLDPPYNSRQYLPNYHLLETIAKYDNPKIRGKTGIREYEKQRSNYCNKTYAKDALEDLINKSNFKYIILSYNNEGLIPEKSIENLFKKYGDKKAYKKYEIPYRRYKRTKDKETKKISEFIFFLKKNG